MSRAAMVPDMELATDLLDENVIRDHHDDDNEEEDEEEDEEGLNLHTQRRRMSRLMMESWRAVEVAAMTIPEEDTTHAIGARLGGTVISESMRMMTPVSSPMINERTKLLRQDDGTEEELKKPKAMGPPPLMKWIWVALACAACYALYNISIKKGSASINPILGGVILQFIAALLGSVLLSIMIIRGMGSEIHYDKKGLLWSVGAGLWVGTAEMVSFVVSGMGVPATQFIPIIIGGSVMFGSVLGVISLGETVMLHGWSGVAMLCVGIAMVATDPGEKVEEGGGGTSDEAPPLLTWIGPALFCALAYALYNICIKKGSASINPIVGAVILQFVAAIYGSCILLLVYLDGIVPEYDARGIFWACWAGLFVGGAELLSFCVSGMGVQASQSIPIIIGGSVGVGAVLGIVLLGEELVLQGWSGVVLLMTGIAFVATDPGEKVEGH